MQKDNVLVVGKCGGGPRVFIGVPDSHFETIRSALTDTKKNAVIIEDADIEWLIIALAKEIGRERTEAVANGLQELFCENCNGTGYSDNEAECEFCDGCGAYDIGFGIVP